ncbi:MAG: nodulation protein NfeD [Streptosporangiales bacterium]|nr:nodulation protein NfeD [Streptosporangiales bacterium]
MLPSAAAGPEQAPTVLTTRVDGTITPVVAEQLADAVRTAEREHHAALLVELDTPGGLLESTRDIVGDFLNAKVPVIVYVAPSGARAGSAGAYITLAAHVAAMAPGTNIGAATPVGGQGEDLDQKIVNDSAAWAISIAERRGRDTEFAENMVRKGTSVPASQAAETGAIDLVASSRAALLAQANGETAALGDGREATLRTAGARPVDYQPNFFRGLLQVLANPELAYLFMSIGTLAIIYELASPGMGFAGITGAILLILGFFSLSVLPFNVAGILLLVLAAALFLAEVFTPGVGVFAAGGAVSLLLAGMFLFEGRLGVNPAVLWPVAILVGLGTLIAGRLAWRARRATPVTGQDALIGHEAVVQRVDDGGGQVQLEGAWWTVRARGVPLEKGQAVRVVDQEDLDLIVEPLESGKDER